MTGKYKNKSYNSNPNSKALRKDARLQLDIEAEYWLDGISRIIPCRVVDISALGMCIQIKAFMAVGDKLSTKFELGNKILRLKCKVAHVYGKSAGLQFIDISNEDQEYIVSYVQAHFFDR